MRVRSGSGVVWWQLYTGSQSRHNRRSVPVQHAYRHGYSYSRFFRRCAFCYRYSSWPAPGRKLLHCKWSRLRVLIFQNNRLQFDAPPFDLGSLVIITHEPVIVNTDATSTVTVSSIQFVTQTVTATGNEIVTPTIVNILNTVTPIALLADPTQPESVTTITVYSFLAVLIAQAKAPTTTITTTVTPKAITKVVYLSVTSTSRASCSITSDPSASSPTSTTLAKREQHEIFEPDTQLRKRDICPNFGPQPTVTMFTSTIISTVTSQVTETETVTETPINSGPVSFSSQPGILRRNIA